MLWSLHTFASNGEVDRVARCREWPRKRSQLRGRCGAIFSVPFVILSVFLTFLRSICWLLRTYVALLCQLFRTLLQHWVVTSRFAVLSLFFKTTVRVYTDGPQAWDRQLLGVTNRGLLPLMPSLVGSQRGQPNAAEATMEDCAILLIVVVPRELTRDDFTPKGEVEPLSAECAT